MLGALPRFEVGDERFFAFEPGLLFFEGTHLDHASLDSLLAERGVVSGILDQACLLDLDDPVNHTIKHEPVVADKDDRALELVAEEDLEPFAALDIEVVGGFVEEEDGGVLEEEFPECDACFLSAGEIGDFDAKLCVGESEAVEDLVDFMIVDESAAGFDLVLDAGLFFEEAVELVVVRIAHLVKDFVQFGIEFFDVVKRTGHGFAEGVLWVKHRVLVEIPDGRFA